MLTECGDRSCGRGVFCALDVISIDFCFCSDLDFYCCFCSGFCFRFGYSLSNSIEPSIIRLESFWFQFPLIHVDMLEIRRVQENLSTGSHVCVTRVWTKSWNITLRYGNFFLKSAHEESPIRKMRTFYYVNTVETWTAISKVTFQIEDAKWLVL
jgi:hypothetical protein